MKLTITFLAGLFLGLAWQNLDALAGCTTDVECALQCPAASEHHRDPLEHGAEKPRAGKSGPRPPCASLQAGAALPVR